MEAVLKIGAEISTPLALIGFAFAAVFLLLQQLIKRNKLPALASAKSVRLIDRFLIFAFAVMVLGIVAFLLSRPKTLEYRGAVLDQDSGDPIAGASVVVLGHAEFYPAVTDSHGTFAFKASRAEAVIDATAHVSHPAYSTWQENRRITENTQADIIRLRRRQVAAVAAASTPAAAASASATPVFEIRWERADPNGQPYAQSFGPIRTENRHGREDIIASGTLSIQAAEARIYSVEYSCVGYPCGWSYNPNGGYGASVQVGGDGRSFTWFRKWDGDPALETYKARYEVPRRVCIRNCG